MSHDDFAFEPVPGLPAHLPSGERMLWQGSPRWQGLARHALHLPKIMLYCAVLVVWVAMSGYADGLPVQAVALSLVWPITLIVALGAIIVGLSYWLARSTIYTMTNRRLVMRFGIVLPMTVNLPFKVIETAAVKRYKNGTGDIPLALAGKDRLAWLHLWPHARPWRFTKPEPMLRDLADVDEVAAKLATALEAANRDDAVASFKAPITPDNAGRPAEQKPATDLVTA